MRPKSERLTVDEARLMPRFRAVFDRINTNEHQATVLTTEINRATSDGIPVSPPERTPVAPTSLRGLPAIGRGVGGAMNGTRPGSKH